MMSGTRGEMRWEHENESVVSIFVCSDVRYTMTPASHGCE